MSGIVTRILAASLLLTIAASVAAAPAPKDDPLVNYYTNTLLTQNQPLYVVRLWLYRDGTFKQFKASHESGTPRVAGWEGTYTLQGNPGTYQVCLRYIPAPASMSPPTPGCSTIASHKIGDVWKVTLTSGPNKGTVETVAVTAGHDTQP